MKACRRRARPWGEDMPGSPATLRRATLRDAWACASVHHTSWRETYSALLPASHREDDTLERRTASWKRWLSRGTEVTVAVVEGRIVGSAVTGSGRQVGGHEAVRAREPDAATSATASWLSCATLPFVPRPAFGALWSRMREALRPRGILAVDLFGDREDWADTDAIYLSRDDVEALLDGLEILELTEEERDGRSFSGPKHWHTFRVIDRRP